MTDAEKIAEITQLLKDHKEGQEGDLSLEAKVSDIFATISLIDDVIEGKSYG